MLCSPWNNLNFLALAKQKKGAENLQHAPEWLLVIKNLLRIKQCQMIGSSFRQNTTNSQFLYLLYDQRIVNPKGYWLLISVVVCKKNEDNSWAAELLHRNDSLWNTTPKTSLLWRHCSDWISYQKNSVNQGPFCIGQLHISQSSTNRVNLWFLVLRAISAGFNQSSKHLLKVTAW